MRADSLRRGLVFALLFGGAMGIAAWYAGGWRGSSRGGGGTDEALVRPGEVAPVAPNLAIGESDDGRLAHDAVTVIDGKPRRYRAWTASWKKSTPQRSADPAVAIQEVEGPHVVLYPEPKTAAAKPVAEGEPGTTRFMAKSGVLTFQKDVRTTAHLTGDVKVERFDADRGDLRLATPSLECTLDGGGSGERRRAQTPERVTIDAGRAHIAGTGLDADLSELDCRVTLLSAVKGRFEAQPGALTTTGGDTRSAPRPTEVTCTGACELVSLDAKAKPAERRWKATFHDNVRVVQGEDSLDCDLLEIEFRMGDPRGGKGQLPPEKVVATGHVRAKGRTETRHFEITCDKATRSRTGTVGSEMDLVVFEGNPVMDLRGELSQAALPGQPAPKTKAQAGRLEIRCDGSATMTTRKVSKQPNAPSRSAVIFDKNVVVRQWEDEKAAEATGELRAPVVTLYGTRKEDGPFQPDTLTAEGPGGVDIRRQDFTSHSGAASWLRDSINGIDKYLLTGAPHVTCANVTTLGFGKAKEAKDSVVVLTAKDNVTVNVYEERPVKPDAPQRPYATISASPGVEMVQTRDGDEVSRLQSDALDAVIAPGRRLEQVRAAGNAHAWGKGPDGSQRDVYGARILLDELVAPPGKPRAARVTALGEEKSPAVAIVREPDGTQDDVRAETLTYDEEGALLTATGHVVANASVRPSEEKAGRTPSVAPKLTDGSVRITAQEARAELGAAEGASGRRALRKVTATGYVLIDGKLSRITGDEATYDALTGFAEVTGRPARVVSLADSERYTSFVNADLIRAYFDVASDDPAKKGQLLRATCPKGGLIVRYIDPPGADGKQAGDKKPRRMQIRSDGPIEVGRTEATAVDNVRADLWSLAPSGDWTDQDATLYCDKAHLAYDADATGAVKDKLRMVTLSGAPGRQVIIEAPDIRGRADRVNVNCVKSTMRFSTESEHSVYVHRLSTGSQLLYDGVTYNYATHEWSDGDRMRGATEELPAAEAK